MRTTHVVMTMATVAMCVLWTTGCPPPLTSNGNESQQGAGNTACDAYLDHIASLSCIVATPQQMEDFHVNCLTIGSVCAEDGYFDCALATTCDAQGTFTLDKVCAPEQSGCADPIVTYFGW